MESKIEIPEDDNSLHSSFSILTCDLIALFNVKSENELVKQLLEKDIPCKRVCGALLKEIPAWSCKNCAFDNTCVLCKNCFEKSREKHKGHTIEYRPRATGCCDCGNPDAWDPQGSCSDHEGLITSATEIEQYNLAMFDKNTIASICEILDKIFAFLNQSLVKYEIDREEQNMDMICEILKYLNMLASSNMAMMNLISDCFGKTYQVTTNHMCLKIDQNNAKKYEITIEAHACVCSTLQNILRVWNSLFDNKLKIDKVFITFLKSYQFKILFGFCYFSLFDIILTNDSKYVKEFSIQVIPTDLLAEKIIGSDEFLYSLFQKLLYLTKVYVPSVEPEVEEIRRTFGNILFEFYYSITSLIRPHLVANISKKVDIFFLLIDTLSIIHNRISFIATEEFQYEGYQDAIISSELYILTLFSFLSAVFDYSDHEKSNEVLFYLIDTIRQRRGVRVISENEYTFHITLNRALAIFLNRYSFHYSMEKNVDIFMAVNEILYEYLRYLRVPDYKFEDLLRDLVFDTLKFIGFLNSLQCKYWVQYGENMAYYHLSYYSMELFYLCDFTLLKLILSQDCTGTLLNLPTLMQMTNTNHSYDMILDDIFRKENDIGIYYHQSMDQKMKKLFDKNMDIVLRLFRNDSYLLDLLAFSYERLRGNKIEDNLLLKIISNEGDNFMEVLKQRIAHDILGKDNSIYLSEIHKLLPFYIKDITRQVDIEALLSTTCEKIEMKNKPVQFRLKDEYLKSTDLSYIINPKIISEAENYLIELKMKEVSLLNTPLLCDFKFLKILNSNYSIHFFTKTNNLQLCTDVIMLYMQKNSSNLTPGIVLNFMKVIDIFITLSCHNGYLSKYEGLLKNTKLMTLDFGIDTGDEQLNISWKYIWERISHIAGENTPADVSMKLKAKEMKEKISAKFKKKKQEFIIANNLDSVECKKQCESNENVIDVSDRELSLSPCVVIANSIKSSSFTCAVCLQGIESSEFFSQGYGRVGVATPDMMIYHSKLQTIKREFEKISEKIPKQNALSMKELMVSFKKSRPELKKSLRFVSCNHYIHFKCYTELILPYINTCSKKNAFIFPCPSCKTLSNMFIPHFDYNNLVYNHSIDEEHQASFPLTGITFEELFKILTSIHVQGAHKDVNLNFYDYIKCMQYEIDETTYQSVVCFVEKILSLQMNSPCVIIDFQGGQVKYYEASRIFFTNSLSLLDILRNDEYDKILQILKEYILSLRFLLKLKAIDAQPFFGRLININFYSSMDFSFENNLYQNIESDKVSQMFFENLYLVILLFQETELGFFNNIIRSFLPLIFLQYFVFQMYQENNFTLSREKFQRHCKYDNFLFLLTSPEYVTPIKKFLIYYLRYACLIKSIFTENPRIQDSFPDVNSEFEYYLSMLNMGNYKDLSMFDYMHPDEDAYPKFWLFKEDLKELNKLLFDTYFKGKLASFDNEQQDKINPALLLLNNQSSFRFISLPGDLLSLSMRYNSMTCNNCHTCPNFAILCLTCGEKICYTEDCCKNLGKHKNEYEYKWHSSICGNGDGVFLQLFNGEIIYSLLGEFKQTSNAIYLTTNGETLKDEIISKDYLLHTGTYANLLKEYTNLSYRNHFTFDDSIQLTEVTNEDEMVV